MKGHKGHHHGKQKAGGGRTEMKVSGNPDVFKEAEGKKTGGAVARKDGGKVDGKHASHRPDHKPRGRKRGGGVGADRSPLSSAHRGTAGAGTGSSNPKDTYGGTPP